MESLPELLVKLLTIENFDHAVTLSLTLFVDFVQLEKVCLLIWDTELDRYIVGDTWVKDAANSKDGADFRRFALHRANELRKVDSTNARCVEPGVFYQPLNMSQNHIGAFLSSGVLQTPDLADEQYGLLIRSVARAIYTLKRLDEADQQRMDLEADRARLEQLLVGVEQQQRTIDRLLSVERELSASLELKVEERTEALRTAQNRLIQSEKLAVIGQLASSLAHELNNPLQAIQSGLGLVVDELDKSNLAPIRGDLNIIQSELDRIEVIFRQMLDFYRPVSFDNVVLDLNVICESVHILLRKRLQEAQVTLQLDLSNPLPLICGDSNQIKQVILNLVLNALDAIVSSSGVITISTAVCSGEVCLAVRDNGSGIIEENMKRLFEPLFTTKTRGLGLGLAISQEIIQRHQGRISVQSSVQTGTKFSVWFPIRDDCP